MILLMPSSHSPLCLEDWLPVSTHLTSILPSDWPAYYIRRGWTALSVVHKHVFVRHTTASTKWMIGDAVLVGHSPPPSPLLLGVRLGARENSAGMRNPGQSQGPNARRLLKHVSQTVSWPNVFPFPSPPSGFAGCWRGTCAKAVVCRSHKIWLSPAATPCYFKRPVVLEPSTHSWNWQGFFWGTGELVKGIATPSR